MTTRQTALRNLITATATSDGKPRGWIVRGGFAAGNTDLVLGDNLTFREAKALAALHRSSGAYANAERRA